MGDSATAAADVQQQPSTANKTVIEHHITSSSEPRSNKGRSLGLIFGLSKPVVAGVLVYAVLATGAWAYLLPNYLALTEQVKELETQVDRLAVEVTELESQVDRYAEENTKLEENMDEFENQNEQLRQSNELYSNLTRGLNGTVIDLSEQNEILVTSNQEYGQNNAELNQTNVRLQEERLALEAAIDEIGNTVLQAAILNQNLLDENLILEGLNGTLTSQIDIITGTILDMDGEIKRLEELTNELQTILSFLESAAEDVGESYEGIVSFLSEQIILNQNLLIETLRNTYQQTAAGWVCGFQSFYVAENFIDDPAVSIGVEAYPDVMEYVQKNVLVPLCLTLEDFSAFLAQDTGLLQPPVDVTTNQLISALNEYTTAAINYYFPDEGEMGLDPNAWMPAGYDCNDLPDELKFAAIV